MLVAQSCLTLCDSIDCSSPGFSVHGILQARILEWVAILFSRGSSQPREWTLFSCIAGRFFTVWATREDLYDKRDFAKVIEVRLLRWGDYFAFTRCFHYNHRVFIRREVEIREGIGSGTRKGRSWSDGRKEQWMRTWRWSPEAEENLFSGWAHGILWYLDFSPLKLISRTVRDDIWAWAEGSGGYSPWGCRVRHNWSDLVCMHIQARNLQRLVTVAIGS